MRWKRVTIDLLFGIILPVLCLIGDPLLFADGIGSGEEPSTFSWLFARYQVLFHGWILVCMAAFLYVHLHRGAGQLHSFLAGTLVAGAVLAAFIGIVLLPVSLPSLLNASLSVAGIIVVAVAAIGFVPFVTAFVYYRQARPLIDAVRSKAGAGRLVVVGAAAPIALAGGSQLLAGTGLLGAFPA